MGKFNSEEIINYYDVCEKNYRRWWDLDRSLALHAGYWDETTKNLNQALKRENEILAKFAKIKTTDKILDAGCGVGGSSLYLSEKFDCSVTGISLSQKQIDLANSKTKELNLNNPPQFLVMDYTKTSFPHESFDVIWAIESVCHASDKRDFIREAWRLLKPSGRLVVADGFHVRNEYLEEDRELLSKVMHGWAVDSMESLPNFNSYLEDQGFKKIHSRDVTKHVLPSSRRLFAYSFPAIALSKIGEYLGWSNPTRTKDFKSYNYQFWAIKKRLCTYNFFYAEKP